MMLNFIQVGIFVLILVTLRKIRGLHISPLLFKCGWIFAMLKLWFPNFLSIPVSYEVKASISKHISIDTFATSIHATQTQTPNLMFIIILLWILPAIFLIIRYLQKYLNIKKIADCSLPDSEYDHLYISDQISTPFTFGILRPKIVFPKVTLQSDAKEMIYMHEKIHIYAWDNVWKWLAICTCCIFWFHPCVWLSRNYLYKDIEILCDLKVIKLLSREARARYANLLIDVGTQQNIQTVYATFYTNHYKERIQNIMKYKKSNFKTFLVGGCILTACALCSIQFTNVSANDSSEASTVQATNNKGTGSVEPSENTITVIVSKVQSNGIPKNVEFLPVTEEDVQMLLNSGETSVHTEDYIKYNVKPSSEIEDAG